MLKMIQQIKGVKKENNNNSANIINSTFIALVKIIVSEIYTVYYINHAILN